MAPSNLTVGAEGLRAENVAKAIKGFSEQINKLKQVCIIQSSSSWQETYFAEDASVLTGGTGSNITGVPRLAGFPYVEPNWTEKTGRHVKYAAEGVISYEDKLTNAINVQARTMKRVAQSVAYAVDYAIHYAIVNATGVNTLAASATWDNATVANRVPIEDILHGIEYCDVDDYDLLEGGYLLLHPEDHTNLLSNSKVINNPSFKTADVVSNGRVGQICGLTIIKSRAVTANQPVLIKHGAVTWLSAKGMTSQVIEDAGIKYTIRAWEIGQIQVTDPEAIHVITGA